MVSTNQIKTDSGFPEFVEEMKIAGNGLVITPVIMGVKVRVKYIGHRINSIAITESPREHIIASLKDDSNLNQVAEKYKLPISLEDEDGISKFMPDNITFTGYIYVPQKNFIEINADLSRQKQPQYKSVLDLCYRIIYNDDDRYLHDKGHLSLILTDFDCEWKRGRSFMNLLSIQPSDWQSATLVFKKYQLPFIRPVFANSKNELVLKCESNPFKTEDFNFDSFGIQISNSDFSSVSVVHEYIYRKQIRAKLIDVFWKTSRDGRLRPYAVFQDNDLISQMSRSWYVWDNDKSQDVRDNMYDQKVSNVSLYAYNWIHDRDLRINDVLILGSGINHTLYVIDIEYGSDDPDRKNTDDIIDIPTYCPHCGSEVVLEDDIDWGPSCANEFCPERRMLIFSHFIQTLLGQSGFYKYMPSEEQIRNMFGQYGISMHELEEGIDYEEDIYEQMNLRNIEDPIAVFLEVIVKDFQEKNKVLKRDRLEIPMHIFIQALGIDGIDRDLAVDLGDRYKNIDQLQKAKMSDLMAIPNMSRGVAVNIDTALNNSFYRRLLNDMKPYIKDHTIHAEKTTDEVYLAEIKKVYGDIFRNKRFDLAGEFEDKQYLINLITASQGIIVDFDISDNGTVRYSYVGRDGFHDNVIPDYIITGKNPGERYLNSLIYGIAEIPVDQILSMKKINQ